MFGFGKKKKKAAQKKSAVAEETSVKNASAEGTRDTSENSVDSVVTSTASSSNTCLLYTSPSPRDQRGSRMPSSA